MTVIPCMEALRMLPPLLIRKYLNMADDDPTGVKLVELSYINSTHPMYWFPCT